MKRKLKQKNAVKNGENLRALHAHCDNMDRVMLKILLSIATGDSVQTVRLE